MIINQKIIDGLKVKKEINGITPEDLKEYGYCHFQEIYKNENGEEIEIIIYELESKTYLIRYANKDCIMFRDITATSK